MFLAHSRSLFFLAFVLGTLVLGASFYLERVVGLVPCSLCVVQRFFLVLVCLVNLLAALHRPGRLAGWVYLGLSLGGSLAGLATAVRQVLLQQVPVDELMICQPDLHCLIQQVPLFDALVLMFRATAECAQIQWTLFDMSIPEWSLLAFIGLGSLSLYQLAGPVLRGAGSLRV